MEYKIFCGLEIYLYLAIEPEILKAKGYNVESFTEREFSIVPCKKVITCEKDYNEALEIIEQTMTYKNLIKGSARIKKVVSDEQGRRSGFAFFVKNEVVATSAEEYYKKAQVPFNGYKLDLLHGKMTPKKKDEVMMRFKSGETQLLISTVVIEVGVDVPNATVMIIENAERFGLSQLHQLRGRIGRGSFQSTCVLLSDAQNEEALTRFQVLCDTNDGFIISQKDLELRGPGDFFGSRQHGLPDMHIANLMTDTRILYEAQERAKEICEKDPALQTEENALLKKEVARLFSNISMN